jgi:hypothetical protein
MIKDEIKFLVSNIRYKEVNDLSLLTDYYQITDELLSKLNALDKRGKKLLSKKGKSKLHACKETVWSLRCSIKYRMSKIINN